MISQNLWNFFTIENLINCEREGSKISTKIFELFKPVMLFSNTYKCSLFTNSNGFYINGLYEQDGKIFNIIHFSAHFDSEIINQVHFRFIANNKLYVIPVAVNIIDDKFGNMQFETHTTDDIKIFLIGSRHETFMINFINIVIELFNGLHHTCDLKYINFEGTDRLETNNTEIRTETSYLGTPIDKHVEEQNETDGFELVVRKKDRKLLSVSGGGYYHKYKLMKRKYISSKK